MNKYTFIILLIFVGAIFSSCGNKSGKPNIIVILADDMGYSDLGCMGSEIETPNLDKLAKNGLLFTHCYNASRCAPSRASLLTGLYQHRTGVGHMIEDWQIPSYRGFLNDKCVTIAEVLKEDGYATIMAGKWHVGNNRENWPDKRGFDNFFGIPAGGGLYFYPSKFLDRPIYRNGELIKPDSATFYSTDNFTTEALQFISDSKSENKPFFLYLAYIAPHWPLQAWPEDIAKYKGKYDTGYKEIRRKRFAKQQKLGIVEQGIKLSPPEYDEWNLVDQKEEASKMEVYAAMVDRMDQNIGRLIEHLKSIGELENTAIVFLSDNGACAEEVNRSTNSKIGTARSFVSYGQNWANVGSTPYRKYKRYEHEGGIHTPMIVHWPDGIKEQGGIVKKPVHIIDILPTCLELAEVNYPEKYRGNKICPPDGSSFSLVFQHKKPEIKRKLFWEHEGNKAIRTDNWKLVKIHKQPWELYDLNTDPTELNNIVEQENKLADSLRHLWNVKASELGVKEWPVK